MGKNIDLNGKKVLISRTDSIGDVMLTLPMVAWIKETFPFCTVLFLCRSYTEKIVQCMEGVDETLLLETIETKDKSGQIEFVRSLGIDVVIHVFPRKSLARLFKKARIPVRIGTSHRSYHLLTCTIRPSFSRKRSPYHESQLNFELMRVFGLSELPEFSALNKWAGLFASPEAGLPEDIPQSDYVILHPKSQGSAREWPIEKYMELAEKLVATGKSVVFTGTEKEGELFRKVIPVHEKIIDSTGKLDIRQLITLINHCSAIVACSTGPLHIGGFLNKCAVGLYSPRIPIHPGRWKPLGSNTHILVSDEECPVCKSGKNCDCLSQIPVQKVFQTILDCQ